MDKILTAWFSYTGNTQKVAEYIQAKVQSDIVRIEPQTAYTGDYNAILAQAKTEIESDYYPALKTDSYGLSQYDLIIVCSPVWWLTVTPPVKTFLRNPELFGKRVVLVITNGGFGTGSCLADVRRLCPNAIVEHCLEVPFEIGTMNLPAGKIDAFLSRVVTL